MQPVWQVHADVTVAVGTGDSAHEHGMVTRSSRPQAGAAPHMEWPAGGVGDVQAGSRTDDVMVGHEGVMKPPGVVVG
jgi:hypothetical protein